MPIQAPAWTDYLNCPVCCREFGAPPRSPVSLCCGHTICKHCLTHLHRRQCPFDQTVVQQDEDELVVNTALLQLAGYPPPAQPHHPPSIQALPEHDRLDYDIIVRRMEELATFLKYCGNANSTGNTGRLSRPMQRKLVTLVQCSILDEEGRGRAARAARSLGERSVAELILQHQNPQQLSANLWAAVRARGCQFLGPAMQEEVLKLVLLALEDGSALSRKVLVMFVVQRLEPHFPQASKTSIGHVVQLLYRASCFKVSKRECDSSLMQLKEEFRTYESLRREHDAQIVQIATESGLRIAPDQWSALLYGDTGHKSHMQSIIDKLQTPQSFSQSVQEFFIALQRTGDPAHLVVISMHLDRLASIDAGPDAKCPTWQQLAEILTSLKEVVSGLIHYLQHQSTGRDGNHNQKHPYIDRTKDNTNNAVSPQSATTPTHVMKATPCRDSSTRAYCPRGNACSFTHNDDDRDSFRYSYPSQANQYGFIANQCPPTSGLLPPPPPPPHFFPQGQNLNLLEHHHQMHQAGAPFQQTNAGLSSSVPSSLTYAEVVASQARNRPPTSFPSQNPLNGMPMDQNGILPFNPQHANMQYNNMSTMPPNSIQLNNMPPNYNGLLTIAPPHQDNGNSQQQPIFVQLPIPGPSSSQSYQAFHGMCTPRYGAPTAQPPDQQIFANVRLQNERNVALNRFTDWYRPVQSSPPWPRVPSDEVFTLNNMISSLPPNAMSDDVFQLQCRTVSSSNLFNEASDKDDVLEITSGVMGSSNHCDEDEDDDVLEEEYQALRRRLATEMDK